MTNKPKEILTPFGKVQSSIVRRLMKVAGLLWDKKNECFVLAADHVEHWKINKAENKLSNERKWYKSYGYLPLRYNNFSVALKAQNGDIMKAMDMCEMFYFRNGKPVYLPDYLCEVNGLDNSTRHFTYGSIFREQDNLKLTL